MSDRARARASRAAAGALVAALVASLGAAPGTAAAAQSGQGVRTLILVRHGLYDDQDPRDDDVGKGLTAQGREQARLVGGRLSRWPAPIDALYSSSMTRARETAAILADSLPGRRPRLTSDLRECTPPTDREDVMATLEPGEADACRARLDRAFARFFRPSAGRDSTDVLVCHGNVIRYFVCRALGLEPSRWLLMSLGNCSLTVIQVRPEGTARLLSLGDVGHLPVELQTSPRPSPAAETMRGK